MCWRAGLPLRPAQLFTTSSAGVNFWAMNLLLEDYAVWYGWLTLLVMNVLLQAT
jgi:hypothetical protein